LDRKKRMGVQVAFWKDEMASLIQGIAGTEGNMRCKRKEIKWLARGTKGSARRGR